MVQIQVIGAIGRDADTKTLSDGREYSSFSVASSNADGTTTWFSVLATKSPKQHDFLTKGAKVFVQGELKTSIYKDIVDLSVYATKVYLCGSAPSNSGTSATDPSVM